MGLTAFLKKTKLGKVVDFGRQLNRTLGYFDSLSRSFFYENSCWSAFFLGAVMRSHFGSK